MKFKKYAEKSKFVIIIVLLIFSSILNYFFQIILNINVVFTHFFYIPIVLACLWWKKKGLFVPIFLAISLILFPFLFGMNIEYLQNVDNLLRALLLLVNGIIINILNNYISKTEELTEIYDSEKFYRELITHDMNNILHNILSSTELYSLYRKKGKNVQDLDNLMSIIRNQGFRGVNLVSNAQKLVKLDKSEIHLEKMNVVKILKDTIAFIQRSFQEREIKISVDAPKKTIWAKANELLSDLFENILFNAEKYNDNPNVEINIKISKELNHEIYYVKIEIKDNGIGIPNERKETIFKEGYNKEDYSKGMGFGLSLVKKIIDHYNGKIWVEDKVPGDYSQGSNFIVLIPEFF